MRSRFALTRLHPVIFSLLNRCLDRCFLRRNFVIHKMRLGGQSQQRGTSSYVFRTDVPAFPTLSYACAGFLRRRLLGDDGTAAADHVHDGNAHRQVQAPDYPRQHRGLHQRLSGRVSRLPAREPLVRNAGRRRCASLQQIRAGNPATTAQLRGRGLVGLSD